MPLMSASSTAPNLRARDAIDTQYKVDHSSIGQIASRLVDFPLFSVRKSLSNTALEEDWWGAAGSV